MFFKIAYGDSALGASRFLYPMRQSGLKDGGEGTGVVVLEPEERF